MDKVLYRRLLRTAIISSPIFALYGVAPLFLLRSIAVSLVLKVSSFLLFLTFIYWLVNIYILKKFGHYKRRNQILLSYLLTSLIQVCFFSFAPKPVVLEIDTPYFFIYPLIFNIAINTVVILVASALLSEHKQKTAEEEVEMLRVKNLEAKQLVLMQQLQPHFLFNTLSILKSLISQNPVEAENYAINLSSFLRYSVDVHKTNVVTLAEELNFTTDYIRLQKMRFGDSLKVNIDVPESTRSYFIPAYAIQLLVENAVKHNSFTESNPLEVLIIFENQGIRVRNNKIKTIPGDHTGTGLSNLNDRYLMLTNTGIDISDTETEFSVFIKLLKTRGV